MRAWVKPAKTENVRRAWLRRKEPAGEKGEPSGARYIAFRYTR